MFTLERRRKALFSNIYIPTVPFSSLALMMMGEMCLYPFFGLWEHLRLARERVSINWEGFRSPHRLLTALFDFYWIPHVCYKWIPDFIGKHISF